MEFIDLFKKTLLENGTSASKVTVKNYIADVKKFVTWFEKNFDRSFPPPALPLVVVEAYLAPIRTNSPRSAKRYESSLRKFFSYLAEKSTISYNPLLNNQGKIPQADPLHLKEFSSYLYTSSASTATIKNYLADVRQFLDWAKEVTGTKLPKPAMTQKAGGLLPPQSSTSTLGDLFAKIDSFLLDEYKNRLVNEAYLSPLSVNRKLSSLKKYISWAHAKGFIKHDLELTRLQAGGTGTAEKTYPQDEISALRSLNEINEPDAGALPSQDMTEHTEPRYSRFAPFRLFQKSKKAINFIFDSLVILSVIKAIEAAKYNFWKATGKQVFAPIPTVIKSIQNAKNESLTSHLPARRSFSEGGSPHTSSLDRFVIMDKNAKIGKLRSIPKSVYAPFKISISSLPLKEKILFHLKYTRPQWYKKYHSYAFSHYLHFALLLVFASFSGFNIYQSFKSPQDPKLVLGSQVVAPGRLISFQGRLNDSQDNPITKETTVKFAIYNSQASSTSLWQEQQRVQPDETGVFTTTLGKANKIDQDIFSHNPNLYLGISVGASSELTPRQELANSGLAKNAEELQGLKPITGNNAGTENVILALDSSGNLTIGGSANPIFQASGGEFRLSGQQLTLATNEGSNTNIVLNPDGTGIIDIQKPLQNTSEDNNLYPGSGTVAIDDNLAVNATSSAQSALVIKQNGAGDLISAITGDTAKFTVQNNGSVSLAGDLSVLGNNLTTTSGTFNIANTNSLILNIGGAASEISIGATTGLTKVNNNLKVAGLLHLPSLPIGSVPFINTSNQLAQDNANFFWDQGNSRLGLGTSTPSYKLSVINNISQSGGAVSTITNTNSADNANTNVLRLNTGVAASGTNARFVTFYAGCTTENCTGTGVGNIHQTGGGITFQSGTADFAERFEVGEATEPGDVIGSDTLRNRKAVVGDKILGVVSDSAIVIGNSPENVNKDKNPVVGLFGQVRTKVSTENGEIKKGDWLTLSGTPGVAKKATEQGQILGIAMEAFAVPPASVSGGTSIMQGKILVLVRPGWYVPGINLGDSEELETQIANDNPNPKISASDDDQNYLPAMPSKALQTGEKLALSIQEFIDTLKGGVLEIGKISTNSLSVATDDIKIGALTLREYISSIVNEILDKRMATEKQKTIVVVSPLASISEAASASAEFDSDAADMSATSEGSNETKEPKETNDAASVSSVPSVSSSSSANVTNITNIYNNASTSATPELSPSPTIVLSPTPTVEPQISATPSAAVTPTVTPSLQFQNTPTTQQNSVSDPQTIRQSDDSDIQSLLSFPKSNTTTTNIASFSAELSYVPNLKSDFAQFNQGLIALGPTSLSDTSISTQLSIGQTMKINDTSINTIGTDLNLQPLRQGKLSLMGGLVAIDTEGNLTVEGNANFAKDVNVRGTLAAGIISPVSEADLVVRLRGKTKNPTQKDAASNAAEADQRGSEFVVADQNGTNKLRINNLGDVISSGSAAFSNFKIIRGAQADTSFKETIASGSAGTAVITTNEIERTIFTPYVTADSLIYITPVTDTKGTTPYIARQNAEDPKTGAKGSFTIQIPTSVASDIKLNWWIIN